jgi:hypothetical protein
MTNALLLASFILSTTGTIVTAYCTWLMYQGLKQTNVELFKQAANWAVLVLIIAALRLPIGLILDRPITYLTAAFSLLTTTIVLGVIHTRVLNKPEQRAMIDHQEIVDELNDLYLHPEKVVDDRK